MRKLFLVLLFLMTFSSNIQNVNAEEFSTKQYVQIEDITETSAINYYGLVQSGIYYEEADSAIGSEYRNFRLDDDYYQIANTLASGSLDYESQIDITMYNLENNSENVQKISQILKYEVFRQVTYVGTGYSYWYDDSNMLTAIRPNYAYKNDDGTADIEMCTDLQKRSVETINNAMKLIDEDMNDIDKALVLHDYLVDKITYTTNDIDQTAGSALANFETVCAGYSKAYSILLDQVGIENHYVSGDAGGNHAWNVIKIENQWYHVDTTWDDLYGATTNSLSRDYFLVTDDFMMNNLHTSWDYYTPDCPSAKYNQSTFIFDTYKDLGYSNGKYYFINTTGTTSLKTGLINTVGSSANNVAVDMSSFEGGDVYKNYAYMFDSDTGIINRYDVETSESTPVFTYTGSGTIAGIEIDDKQIMIRTNDGQISKNFLDGYYYGDIEADVLSFSIDDSENDGYFEITGVVKLVSKYDNQDNNIEALPQIYLWNVSSGNYDDFTVEKINDTDYSFALTLTNENSVFDENSTYLLFEDVSENNQNKSDYEYLSSTNNSFGTNKDWQLKKVKITANEDYEQDTYFTLVNQYSEEEILKEFYTYVDNAGYGYRVELNEDFKIKLNDENYQEYSVGNYTWKTGDPLPNPALNGEFEGVRITSLSQLFHECTNVKILDLSLYDTSNVSNMASMFDNCENLETVDVSSFDTSSVFTMSMMFYNCSSLTTLDLSGFDTQAVEFFSVMFGNCENLKTLDISNFNTSKASDMDNMFSFCSSITELDLSHFNTPQLISMRNMFAGMSLLETLDISSFDTSNVTDMRQMFENDIALDSLDLSNFTLNENVDLTDMFMAKFGVEYPVNKFIQGYAKDIETTEKFNDSSVTGIDLDHFKFESVNKEYVGNINSELIDLQIFPIDDGTGDYAISGKVVVVEWVNGVSTVPGVAPVMAFKGDYGDKLDVFVTAEGTNTYYFDRRISSTGLVDGQDFRFEITSGDPNNISENKSMYLYLSTSPNVEHEKSFRISDSKSISYEMDNNGQLVIFNEDDPYDYIGNINSELINLDIIPVDDGTGDVVITGEVIVVEWVNALDPMGDPNENAKSTVPRETPIMNFVASDESESISVFVTPMGTNTFYFDRRISGEGLVDGKEFNFNIKSGNERNLSEYNNINLYLSTSVGVDKYREFTLPSGKIIQYYENGIGELELNNKVINDSISFTASVEDDGYIEGAESGKYIRIELENSSYFKTNINSDNIVVTNLPQSVSCSEFNYIDSDTIEIILSGNSSVDYDDDITVSIVVKELAVNGLGSDTTVNATLKADVVAVPGPAPTTPVISEATTQGIKISGITDEMEIMYSQVYNENLENNTWYEINEGVTEIDNIYVISGGVVYFRYRETLSTPASEIKSIEVTETMVNSTAYYPNPTKLVENQTDGVTVTLNVIYDTFIESQLSPDKITTSMPGITVSAVTYHNSDTIKVTLSGNQEITEDEEQLFFTMDKSMFTKYNQSDKETYIYVSKGTPAPYCMMSGTKLESFAYVPHTDLYYRIVSADGSFTEWMIVDEGDPEYPSKTGIVKDATETIETVFYNLISNEYGEISEPRGQ